MLIRARKRGLVAFDGEMLYQGQDDDEPIILYSKPDELLLEVCVVVGDCFCWLMVCRGVVVGGWCCRGVCCCWWMFCKGVVGGWCCRSVVVEVLLVDIVEVLL